MKKFEPWKPKEMQKVFTTRPGTGEGEDSILIGVKSRDPPSIISSATSSNASVATNASTSALLGNKVKRYLKGGRVPDKLTQKELNILLAGQGMEATKEEMEDPVENRQPRNIWGKSTITKQVLAALAVSLGSLVIGFSSSYTGPAVVSLKEPDSTLQVTLTEISWIGSLMPLFALVGGICGGPLIEGIGRRNTILLTGLPFMLAYFLISFATNIGMIFAGRILTGLCVGIASLALPVYLGETIEARVRGTLGLLPTTIGNLGILLSNTAGSFLNWSNLALLGACLPVPFLVSTIFIPESPLWHVSRGDNTKAEKALQWLRGKEADISEELKLIIKAHKDMENVDLKSTMKELFSRNTLKPFFICIGLMFFQQLSGVNAVIFYSVDIFKDAGSTIDSNLSSIIVAIVNLTSTLVATFLIDKLGRKILLYISNTLMAISLALLAAFFYYKADGYDLTTLGWVPLVAFVVYIFAFAIGAGPIPWLMMGEILPAKVRGAAASIVTAFNWTCTFIVTKSFIDINNMLGTYTTFATFAVICFAGIFFTIRYVPETQGKTLEEIEEQLTGKKISLGSIKSKRALSVASLKPLPSMV